MVNQTFDKYKKRFDGLSPMERVNWRRWKLNMLKDIKTISMKGPPRLSARLRKGTRDLKELNVVLKQADKNLGMVPIRGDIYNAMVRDHLESSTYRRVGQFPHQAVCKRLENIIKLRTSSIPLERKKDWVAQAQQSKEPCPFYAIPKIHKPTLSSRPITAQHSYMLAPLSQALAKVLQPICDRLDEIARDSKMVVQQLETRTVEDPCVFLTYDVEKLYPSINLRDAISTLQENIPMMRQDQGFWTKVLQLIMYNNYVLWDDKVYRQMEGTATGTQVAPPFANLYLFFKFKNIFDEEGPNIIYQSRFLDDGLVLARSNQDAERIIQKLNNTTNLTLTHQISDQEGTYLDLDVYKGRRYKQEKLVDIKVHFKGTNKFLYLPALSNHPGAHKAAIVKGEAIRCLRNTSDKIEWLKALHLIFKGLMARGYSGKMIKRKWKEVRFEDRQKYVFESSQATRPPGTTVIVPFHREAKAQWRRMTAKHPLKNLLAARRFGRLNNKQRSILEDWPPSIVYKDFRKIGGMVINAREVWKSVTVRNQDRNAQTVTGIDQTDNSTVQTTVENNGQQP